MSAPRRTLAAGASAALGGQLTAYVIGLVTSVLIARALGAEGRGEYLLPLTAASTVLAFAALGLESAAVVAVAERRATATAVARLSTALALAVGPIAAALVLVAHLVTADGAFAGVSLVDTAIVAATVPFSLHLTWRSALFVLDHRIARVQIALVAGAAVQLAGIAVAATVADLGVRGVLCLYAVSVLVQWSVLAGSARAALPVGPRVDRPTAAAILPFGLKLLAGLVLVQLLLRFDVFLVAALLDADDVGRYTLAVLFAELTWLVTTPLAQAVVPFQADLPLRESAGPAFKAARLNLVLALVLALGFAATLWWAIPAVYGADFEGAYGATLALLPGVVIMAFGRPLTVLVTRRIRPGRYSAVAAAVFALNVAANLVLLEPLGIVGAGVASTIAYVVFTAVLVRWACSAAGLGAREALMPRRDDVDAVVRFVRRQGRRSSASSP